MIKKVGVMGAGFMGIQLAFYLLKNNISVALIDISVDQIDAAKKQISFLISQFGLDVEILSLLMCETNLEFGVHDCQLVIDCTPEDRDLKLQLFANLESYCSTGGILATNSSAISVSELDGPFYIEGSATRVLNMHFLPPIWDRPLVEIMRGQFTSDITVKTIVEFVKSISLVPVVLKNENRGFVFNFIWQAIKATSLDLLDRDIADIADIDLAWRTGMGMKIGPFQVMDMVGLDVVATVFIEHGQPVPKSLAALVSAGKLGQKTGSGFYSYT